MLNENIMMILAFLVSIVSIYGIIGSILFYKRGKTKKEAIESSTQNLKVTIFLDVIILIVGVIVMIVLKILKG